MKPVSLFLLFTLFTICLAASISGQTAKALSKDLPPKFINLNGNILSHGNTIDPDGNIRKYKNTLLQIRYTQNKTQLGTFLLLPGGDYHMLNTGKACQTYVSFLLSEGFNVATLEYSVSKERNTRNAALKDALMAFHLLSSRHMDLGLKGNRIGILGFSSGGHLAARIIQRLGKNEQPDQLILINPAYLNETLPESVFPEVVPPIQPRANLFVSYSKTEDANLLKSTVEYCKTWKGYDGQVVYGDFSDTVSFVENEVQKFQENSTLGLKLKSFLENPPVSGTAGANPAAVPVEGYASARHAEKLALISKNKYDLIMVGNSITNNFDKPEYQPVWNQFFAPRNALNLGYSGYRTENILWNLEHGELEGQSPKVVVLEIGTNNVDEKNYPTRHTAGQLAGGIEAIVNLLRTRLPESKIIVLRCFPGCYGGPNPTSHRAILERASEIVSKLADGKHVFYCDVNHVFLNMDGSINHDAMPDWLHPSPAGAKAWAQAMEPLLSELTGTPSLDTDIPANTAIVPATKLENDSYDWWTRHADVLSMKDSINPEIVLIGNSITHFWGGLPLLKNVDGTPRTPNGPKTWDSLFHNHRVLNLGFGWDRTQNVLWRLDHGELDRLHPKTVIIHIGTNNTSQTDHARMNTAPEIVEGIRAVCLRVRSKVPGARIILMEVFPREEKADHPRRILINEINKLLEQFAKEQKITLVNIGPRMLDGNGTFLPGLTFDYCHPTEKGYKIWADAIRPYIEEP